MFRATRRLWRRLQTDPALLRSFHGWATVFWLANFPPVVTLYLLVPSESFQNFCLLYLALVSVYANVAGEWSAWQASRIEVAQQEERERDTAAEVVDQLVERTEIRPVERDKPPS